MREDNKPLEPAANPFEQFCDELEKDERDQQSLPNFGPGLNPFTGEPIPLRSKINAFVGNAVIPFIGNAVLCLIIGGFCLIPTWLLLLACWLAQNNVAAQITIIIVWIVCLGMKQVIMILGGLEQMAKCCLGSPWSIN